MSEKKTGIGEEFRPSLAKAGDAAIKKVYAEISGARHKVHLDEGKIYGTLLTELLEEGIAQKELADRRGISLPTDAGANAIATIKSKYFSKMGRTQIIDSFKNLTSLMAKKRREDKNYVGSIDYRMDDYWLKGLAETMHDTRFFDDAAGIAEAQALFDMDPAYGQYFEDYKNRKPVSSGGERGVSQIDLRAIQVDFDKSNAFRALLKKIGLDVELLGKSLGPSDIRDLQDKVDRQLFDRDLNMAGVNADQLKGLIAGLTGRGAYDTINILKEIIAG